MRLLAQLVQRVRTEIKIENNKHKRKIFKGKEVKCTTNKSTKKNKKKNKKKRKETKNK